MRAHVDLTGEAWSDSSTFPGSNVTPIPAYQRIVADIATQIAAGQLAPGQKLPSARELGNQYGVSNIVVRTAITILKERRLVVSSPGLGVFVAEPTPDPPISGG